MPITQPLTPTCHGYILSNEDALMVIQAALANKFPLVKRRPLYGERLELIRLGNVFVFIEEKSDIKRWTDGVAWSASRIFGRFLIYRKLDKNGVLGKDDKRKVKNPAGKRNGSRDAQFSVQFNPQFISETDAMQKRASYSSAPHSEDVFSDYDSLDTRHAEYAGSSSREVSPSAPIPVAQDRGLIKKTLSLKLPISEPNSCDAIHTVHLISYFSAYDVLAGNLVRPSQSCLKEAPVNSSLWLAIRRSSLGGKLLMENEVNFYLDSNYQLQNMNSLLVPNDGLLQAVKQERYPEHQRIFSAGYPPDAVKFPLQGVPVNGMARAPYRPSMSAPVQSLLTTLVGSEHHFFPEASSASMYTGPLWLETPSNLCCPDVVRGISSAPLLLMGIDPIDNGHEQYYGPGVVPPLNNRAFGVQVSQQAHLKPYVLNNSQQSAPSPQQRWDAFPASAPVSVGAQRLDEEIEYDSQEMYNDGHTSHLCSQFGSHLDYQHVGS